MKKRNDIENELAKTRSTLTLNRAEIKGIKKNGEIRIAVSTDKAILRRTGWFDYLETLSHESNAIGNMDFVRKNGVPILLEHMHYDYNSVVGRATDPEIIIEKDGTKKLMLTMNLGGTEKSDEVRALVERGYLMDVSVSYRDNGITIDELPEPKERDDNLIVPEPEYDVRFEHWDLTEVSFCAMGADAAVGTGARGVAPQSRRIEEQIKKFGEKKGRVYNPFHRSDSPTAKKGESTMQDEDLKKLKGSRMDDEDERMEDKDDDRMDDEEEEKDGDGADDRDADAGDGGNREEDGDDGGSRKSAKQNPRTKRKTRSADGNSRSARALTLISDLDNKRSDLIKIGLTDDDLADLRSKVNAGKIRNADELNERKLEMLSRKTELGNTPPAFNRKVGDKNNTYSLARAIGCAAAGRPEGYEGEIAQEHGRSAGGGNAIFIPYSALNENERAQQDWAANSRTLGVATTIAASGANGNGIVTDKFDDSVIVQRLFARSKFLNQCSVIPMQLNQDLIIAVESGDNQVNWAGEVTTRNESNPHIQFTGNRKWSLKEVTSQIIISRHFMDQAPVVENRIYKSLSEDLPREIEKRILSQSTGGSISGIADISGINTIKLGANANVGGNVTFQKLIELAAELEDANAADLGAVKYVTNSRIASYMRRTKKFSASGADTTIATMMSNGVVEVDGMEVIVTNLMEHNLAVGTLATANASRVICCIPSEVMLGYFSGYEIIVDPYTKMNTGQIQIQVRQALDVQYLHPAAFAMISDAVT